MRAINSWNVGDITTDTFEDFLEFFSKLDKELTSVTLRPLNAEVLFRITPDLIPQHIEMIKVVNILNEELSTENERYYLLSESQSRQFIQRMRPFKVEIIGGARRSPLPPPRELASVSVPDSYYSLDDLEERARARLGDCELLEQGFTLDSPHAGDREYGVYDSLEMTFRSPHSRRPYIIIFDRFAHKISANTSEKAVVTENDLQWLQQKLRSVKAALLSEGE